MAIQAFTFVKKNSGGLTISLESYNFSAPKRDFTIPHNISSIVVPYVYAVGLFVSEGALNQMKLGYFEVKNIDELLKEAATHGLVATEDLPKENRFDRIRKIMAANNIVEVKKILKSKDPAQQGAIVSYAVEKRNSLTNQMIKLIEEECGISMTVDE